MSLYTDLGLDRTIRVPPVTAPAWGSPLAKAGPIERGIEVPHDGANVSCNAIEGWRETETWTLVSSESERPANWKGAALVPVRCKKRIGHGDHVAVDIRMLAAPPNMARSSHRFAPNRIPAGVDLDITAPHDCANHLD